MHCIWLTVLNAPQLFPEGFDAFTKRTAEQKMSIDILILLLFLLSPFRDDEFAALQNGNKIESGKSAWSILSVRVCFIDWCNPGCLGQKTKTNGGTKNEHWATGFQTVKLLKCDYRKSMGLDRLGRGTTQDQWTRTDHNQCFFSPTCTFWRPLLTG